MKLSHEQIQKICLFRSRNVGPITYNKLINKFGSAENAIDNFPELNKQYKKKFEAFSPKDAEKEVSKLHKLGGQIIFKEDDHFPALLRHISDCPPFISIIGSKEALTEDYTAIVGNRSASGAAIKFTKKLSTDLTTKKIGVISGMARGIDTAAHQGALDATGKTIAVLAGGVDHIYPPENAKLYEEIIASGGAIISEMPLGMFPSQNHFPRRNRIVSGIARAVAVIEAAKRSGSLITANLAAEQNRDIYAMPNIPTDPRSEGPNHLLSNGAFILRNADDIIQNTHFDTEFYNPKQPVTLLDIGRPVQPNKIPANNNKTKDVADTDITPADQVLALLSKQPMDTDSILQQTQLDEVETTILLTELELMGDIQRSAGGFIKA
jgi:DNA processing protein